MSSVGAAAAGAVEKSRRSTRYFSLDHWRGVACLMVVVFHAAYYITGNLQATPPSGVARRIFDVIGTFRAGVPIFFVISGYCIAAACDAMRLRDHSVRTYFQRRFRRIYPPYWIAVGLALVLVAVLLRSGRMGLVFDPPLESIPNPFTFSPARWFGNLTLIETWRTTLAGGENIYDGLFLLTAWTLCYEEQFYAVCGLILLLSPRRFFEIAAGITVVVTIVAAARFHFRNLPIDGFFFDGRWLTFAIGVAVYYRLHQARSDGERMLLDLFLAMTLVGSITLYYLRPGLLLQELSIAALFGIIIRLLYRWDRAINESRGLLPIRWCGVMCYSLYLIHWPVVKVLSHSLYLAGIQTPWETLLITVPACIAASILASWGFFLLVERRFMTSQQAIASSQIHEVTHGHQGPAENGIGLPGRV